MDMRVLMLVSLGLLACGLESGTGAGSGGAGAGGVGAVGGNAGVGGVGGNAGVGGGSVCALPFDGGPCDAAFGRWAFVPELGACFLHTWGGCGGNDNNFQSRADCESACPLPDPSDCPPNRAAREICLMCGPAGGCAEAAFTCALICADQNGCTNSTNVQCVDGVCQVGFCI